MWDGFNQRKFPRLRLHCEITIQPQGKTKPIVATTENVGAGGVCVIQDQPLERFTPCSIRLDLEKGQGQVECHGKVAWSIERREVMKTRNRFDTGIEFTNITPEDLAKIRAFIQQHLPKGFEDIA